MVQKVVTKAALLAQRAKAMARISPVIPVAAYAWE